MKFVLAMLLPLGSFLGAATVSLAQNTPYPGTLTHTSKTLRRVSRRSVEGHRHQQDESGRPCLHRFWGEGLQPENPRNRV